MSIDNTGKYYDRDRNYRNPTTGAVVSRGTAGTMNHAYSHHGNVAEYQASGIPFAQKVQVDLNHAVQVDFPFVTQWIQVIVDEGDRVQVAFQESALAINGGGFDGQGTNSAALAGTNHVVIDASVEGPPNGSIWRIKTNKIFFAGLTNSTTNVYIIAGLTSVPGTEFPDLSGIIGIGTTAVITDNDGTAS